MHDSPKPDGTGYEQRDVTLRPILLAGTALVAGLVGSMGLMSGLLGHLRQTEAAASPKASPLVGYGPQTPPAPRLQTDPAGDLRTLRADEQARLEGYAWVDQGKTIVRIPIERAMELLAQRRGTESR